MQKSCGLLASVIVASFEPGFMFVRLDPVQTPSKEAAPGLSSVHMGGFKVSPLQRALLTDLWFYSQHPTAEIFPCLAQDSFNLICLCEWVKKEYLPDTNKNVYLNLLIGLCCSACNSSSTCQVALVKCFTFWKGNLIETEFSICIHKYSWICLED